MRADLFRALAVLAEPPTTETSRIARLLGLEPEPHAASYTELFVLQLFPYASVYLGGEGMLGGEARDRIAGAWRAVGAVPPTEPDHLAVLLGAHARAIELEHGERDAARHEARHRLRATLLWEHLLSWVGPYLAKLDEIGTPPYAGWGGLLRRALMAEAQQMGPPETLPLALRAAPVQEADGKDDLLGHLLAPVRSGIVLTRYDLARCARDLGLGLRQGERRYMLQALLEQDALRTVGWLAAEARRWEDHHLGDRGWLGDIAEWWAARARGTVDLVSAVGC